MEVPRKMNDLSGPPQLRPEIPAKNSSKWLSMGLSFHKWDYTLLKSGKPGHNCTNYGPLKSAKGKLKGFNMF